MRRAVRPADLPVLCLAAAVAISGAILIDHVSHLTFLSDEWELLVNRHGWSAGDFLDPYQEHLVLAQAALYKLLLALFGMDSALPFQVVATVVFLLGAVVLFVHLRTRVGAWPALLAAVLVLFLGDAFEDLLLAFQVGHYGSVAAGLGMLIALDRDDRQGDRIACALLALSLSFSSIGLCFAAGALADLALSRRPRAGRLYVALLPLELYAIWWLGWGHTADSNLSAENVRGLPEYVFKAIAAGIVSLLGLATGDGSEPDQPHLIYGEVLLVAGVCLAVFRLRQLGRVPRDLLIVLAIGLSFWVVAGLARGPDRFPTSSRYQYPSAIFLLLIAAELLRGVRIRTRAVVVAAVVGAWAISGGMSLLYREYEERWVPSSDSLRASLAGVEIARGSIVRSFQVDFVTVTAPARAYFDAVDEDGSPAYGEDELAGRPEADRQYADGTLATALGIRLAAARPPDDTRRCDALDPATTAGLPLSTGAHTLVNTAPADVEVLLGRFSDGLPVGLGPLPAGGAAALEIPADRSDRPWRLGVSGQGPVAICAP